MLDAMEDEEGLGESIIPYVNEYIRKVVVPTANIISSRNCCWRRY